MMAVTETELEVPVRKAEELRAKVREPTRHRDVSAHRTGHAVGTVGLLPGNWTFLWVTFALSIVLTFLPSFNILLKITIA